MPTGVYPHKTPWNKGLKMPLEYGLMRAHSFRGRSHTEEAKQKVSDANINHPVTNEMRRKMSEAQIGRVGSKSGNWKGGVTKENALGRGSKKYREWKKSVLEGRNICFRCESEVNLEAHHIKKWVSHPELRYDVNNGVAVCYSCHKFYHGLERLEVYLVWEVSQGQQDRIECYVNRISALEVLNMPFTVRTRQTYVPYWKDVSTHRLPRRVK